MIQTSSFNCNRCNHDWQSNVAYPKQCPKCHSPYWDKPRTYKLKRLNNQSLVSSLSLTDPIDLKVSEIIEMAKNVELPTTDRTAMIYKSIKWITEAPDNVLNGILENLAKHRVLARHPNCHTAAEVINEQCQKSGKTLEQLTSEQPKKETTVLVRQDSTVDSKHDLPEEL